MSNLIRDMHFLQVSSAPFPKKNHQISKTTTTTSHPTCDHAVHESYVGRRTDEVNERWFVPLLGRFWGPEASLIW